MPSSQRVAQRPDVDQAELVDPVRRSWRIFAPIPDLARRWICWMTIPCPTRWWWRPAGTGANLETLVADLDSLEETALVQLDTAWLERLRAILELARRVVDVTTVLLSLAVIAIIGNTIRLEIGNRREEIEIVKLVGASDGYIRRPFLYLGLCYGVGAGVLAALIVVLGLGLVSARRPGH